MRWSFDTLATNDSQWINDLLFICWYEKIKRLMVNIRHILVRLTSWLVLWVRPLVDAFLVLYWLPVAIIRRNLRISNDFHLFLCRIHRWRKYMVDVWFFTFRLRNRHPAHRNAYQASTWCQITKNLPLVQVQQQQLIMIWNRSIIRKPVETAKQLDRDFLPAAFLRG